MRRDHGRRIGIGTAVIGGSAVLLMLAGGVASAHVTVAAPGVTTGQSDATIVFRVPDESATASTVGLRVQLPLATPLAGVLVAPVPGWTASMVSTKLAKPITTDDGTITEVVSEIDWTAEAGNGIAPGFFGQFPIIAGQLPDDVSTLTFKAIQTYSDHTVVSWIEQAAPGSSVEPEHPAPGLTLPPPSVSPSTATAPPTAQVAPATAATVPPGTAPPGTAPPGTVLSATPVPPEVAGQSGAGQPAAGGSGASAPESGMVMAEAGAASKTSVGWALILGLLGVVAGIAGVVVALGGRRQQSGPPAGR